MANRQALRELQSRLAERLQVARAEGVTASWLAVVCKSHRYLFPLDQSGEIFPWNNVQAVPYTRPWFLGVANLRGGLYGVVDLSAFVAQGSAPLTVDTVRAESRLVVFNAALEVNCAILVDQLAGLRSPLAFSAVEPPPADAPPYFGNLYTEVSGERWQEVNLQHMARLPDFLSIGI